MATSCATHDPSVPAASVGGWSVEQSTLSWLKDQQQSDGHWGTAEHRVELTSLVALAFLSQGETPVSDKYGKTVENALRALVRDVESETDQSGESRALLAWALAEAFGFTRVPMVLDAARVQAGKLNFDQATPWHALAAQALLLSGSCPELGKQGIATMHSGFPSQTNSILNQATHAILAMQVSDRNQVISYLEAVRRLSPARWRTHENPLPSAVMLSTALLWTGGRDWQEWHKVFYTDVVSRQIKRKTLGWWTTESMGLTPRQLPDLAGAERNIYVTCMVLLTFPPSRRLPSFKHLDAPGKASTDADEEIKVEIR